MSFEPDVITAELVRTGEEGAERVEMGNDSSTSFPDAQIRFYTGNPDEVEPGKITAVSGTPNSAVLNFQAPELDTSGGSIDLWTDDVTGSRVDLSADFIGLFGDVEAFGDMDVTGAITADSISDGTGWTNLTLVNSWVTSGGLTPAAHKDVTGRVQLRGRVQSGVVGTVCTLPAGMWPSATMDYALRSTNGGDVTSWVQVTTAGVVIVQGNLAGAQTSLSLAGCNFPVA